ncbi:MAG: cobaltochelatase subunit CobN [Proteobacteria bacterium]|nr:cobaltochelatase subunit CobN [Pseudomonadota bacterium]
MRAFLLGLLWFVTMAAPAAAQAAGRVLIVTASPVAPGKFVTLAREAQAQGLSIEARYAEKLGAEPGPALWDGADLVLIDAPRQHIEDYVRAKLGAALPALAAKPHVWLPTQAPKPGGGLDAAFAQRLHAYYVNGGRANTRALLQLLDAQIRRQDWRGLPPPQVFPPAALYHPALPSTVVATAAEYLAWKGVDPRQPHPPIVGIAFHQQTVSAEQTGLIDALVQRIEAGGAIAMPFYSPVLDPDAMRRLLSVDGKLIADVLINTQITLSPELRRNELQAMGIPVVQAMVYRRGDADAWRADPQGVPLMDVPFYLAQAEYTGISDIQTAAATRKSDEQLEAIAPQADAVAAKALNLARLRHLPAADKKLAIFFWNYPAGEKNLSASFMNLPRSLSGTLAALHDAGYRTERVAETPLTLQLQRLLAPGYRAPQDQSALRELLRDGLAAKLPLAAYRAWLTTLPAAVQAALRDRWGDPARSSMVLDDAFVIPRLQLGNVTLLPQPGRGERGDDREKALYHSTSAVPPHHYLAAYLWVRQPFKADALVHFGTHGTQEWLPGKERGLSVHDWPMLAVGDVPVLYPYIVDNIGEATQAKRRGRAVIISHQTPAFAPAGLHDKLTRIHDLLHQWLAQDAGGVKDRLRAQFLDGVRAERIDRDLGWAAERIEQDFPRFLSEVHDHLHELAHSAQPMGLHSFGQGSGEQWRIATVLMMLGKDFWEGVADTAAGEEADEMLVGDYTKLPESKPYRTLAALLKDGTLPPGLKPERAGQARDWYDQLGAQGELRGLLDGLAGRYIPTSYGGDPIKNPDALPTGRNLYGFDPSRVPTKAAWEAGQQALQALLAAHRAKTGKLPAKLAFTLWSVETMRHFGLLEAQALWALGVEPVWDAGGRVSDVRLVPRDRLGRPRVDVVLSATGLYRDHFPNVMKQLARAAQLASEADEADNPVADNARRIGAQLQRQGVPAAEARRAGATRIFSSESGRYGTGLDDAALATDSWKTQAEGDRKLAQLYLSRMQYAYGPDEAEWGRSGVSTAGKLNLYAEHLRGTEAAVLARSSALYGMLTTDDPFQYLGGIGLAVRQLDGKAPELYISNLRGSGAGKVEGAAGFLAKELATRNFHPGYIQGLMAEGYAGTLQVLDGVNNFAGWQSVAREIVRDDQWQEFMDVYVRDKHNLGLKRWFEAHNPHALAQSIERMLEAARLGQWKADPQSVAELKARYRELAQRHDVRSDNATFKAYVDAGFGLQAPAAAQPPAAAAAAQAAPATAEPPSPAPPPPPPIRGLRLDRVLPTVTPSDLPGTLLALLLIVLATAGGAWRARPLSRPESTPLTPSPA